MSSSTSQSASQSQSQSHSIDDSNNESIDNGRVQSNSSMKESKEDMRSNIRKKYDDFIKGSTETNDEEKILKAIEELRKLPEASNYNLIPRKKQGKVSGLIILNRISGSNSGSSRSTHVRKVEELPDDYPTTHKKEEEVPEVEIERKDPKVTLIEDEPPLTPEKVSRRMPRRVTSPVTPRKPRITKDPSTETILGLTNRINLLEKRLDKMKLKKSEKELFKSTKRAQRNLEREISGSMDIRSPTIDLYDRLDHMSQRNSNPFGTSEGNNKFLYY